MFRDAGEKDLTALRQLHENFPPNDSIAAISISLGNDNKKLWKSLIENYKIAGTNLYEPHGFYSELADKLLIRDLPIYFLIDEEGNIEIPGTSDLDEIRKKTLAN